MKCNRVRRRLTLQVSEPLQVGEPAYSTTAGARFATGWACFNTHKAMVSEGCHAIRVGDPVQVAGYLAAKAAWDAHHFAVNYLDESGIEHDEA